MKLIDKIVDSVLAFFWRDVDTIISPIVRIAERLEKAAEAQEAKAVAKLAEATKAAQDSLNAKLAANKAVAVANNLKSLVDPAAATPVVQTTQALPIPVSTVGQNPETAQAAAS